MKISSNSNTSSSRKINYGDNFTISPLFDDDYYLDNLGSIQSDSSTAIYLTSNDYSQFVTEFGISLEIGDSAELTDLDSWKVNYLINVFSGNNILSNSVISAAKYGYFITDEYIKAGKYPVTPVLVGDRTFTITRIADLKTGSNFAYQPGVSTGNSSGYPDFSSIQGIPTIAPFNSGYSNFNSSSYDNWIDSIISNNNTLTLSDHTVNVQNKDITMSEWNSTVALGSFSNNQGPYFYVSKIFTTTKQLKYAVSTTPILFIEDGCVDQWQSENQYLLNVDYPDRKFSLVSPDYIWIIDPSNLSSDILDHGASKSSSWQLPSNVFTKNSKQIAVNVVHIDTLDDDSSRTFTSSIMTLMLSHSSFTINNPNRNEVIALKVNGFNFIGPVLLKGNVSTDANTIPELLTDDLTLYDNVNSVIIDDPIYTNLITHQHDGYQSSVANFQGTTKNIDGSFANYDEYFWVVSGSWDVSTNQIIVDSSHSIQTISYLATDGKYRDVTIIFNQLNVPINTTQPRLSFDLVDLVLEPLMTAIPWDTYYEQGVGLKLDISTDSDSMPYFCQLPITTGNWYDVYDSNDQQLVVSDVMDSALSDCLNTDDVYGTFMTRALTYAKQLKSQSITDSQEVSNLSTVGDVANDGEQLYNSIKDETVNNIKQQVPGITDQIIDQTLQSLKDNCEDAVEQVSQPTSNDFPYDFLMTCLAYCAGNNSVTEIIGLIRIAQTNPDQLPSDFLAMFQNAYDYTLDEIAINATSMENIVVSILGYTTSQICDTLDITNELALINSTLGDQASQLAQYITAVSNNVQNYITSDASKITSDVSSLVTSFEQDINNMITNLSDQNNNLEDKLNQLINTDGMNSYDQALLTRNKTKTIGYNTEFLKAMKSDPYLAISDHITYVKRRASSSVIKLKTFESILSKVQLLDNIPNIAIDALYDFGTIVSTLISKALNVAVQSITIIDNIDKLNFIAEQFLSIRSKYATTNPSSPDSLFEKPAFNVGDYPDFSNLLRVDLHLSGGVLDVYNSYIDDWVQNGYQPEYGEKVTVTKWDPSLLFSNDGGYYLPPLSDDQSKQLPVICVGSTSKIKGMFYGFDFDYPQRGSLHKQFGIQLNNLANQLQITTTDYSAKSSYLPLTSAGEAIYSGFVILAGATSAAVAAAGALLQGNLIGAAIGAATAGAATLAANGVALAQIVSMRGLYGSNTSIYEALKNDYDSNVNNFSNVLNDASDHVNAEKLLALGYNLVIIDSDTDNIVTDASNLKKAFIYIKEIVNLTMSLVAMVGVSFMIGSITAMIQNKIHGIKAVRAQRQITQRETQELTDNYEQMINSYDAQIAEVESNEDMDDKSKEQMITGLQAKKDELTSTYKGELALQPKTRKELRDYVANNNGINQNDGDTILSSVGSKLYSVITDIPSSVLNVVGDEISKIKDYYGNNPSLTSDGGDSQVTDILNSMTDTIGQVPASLEEVLAQLKIIKRYT